MLKGDISLLFDCFLSWQELDGKDLGADAPLSVSWLFCSAAHGQGMTAQQGSPTHLPYEG